MTASSSIQKANLLNKFFSTCFSPASDLDTPDSNTDSGPCLTNVSCSQDEVLKHLSNLQLQTASGPDGISSHMLRSTASSITPTITRIFNESLKQMKVPDHWKMSNVTPIPKSGDPTSPTNYRPISLLSLVSKVLERIVHSRISAFIFSNNLLSTCQFGFRPRSSTQEALLSVTRNWFQLLSEHRQVACVFFDVKKAFDSVPHRKIIDSLSGIGIKGPLLNWLRDYLSGRRQRVVLDGTTSDPVNVSSGVPQGSILGPLLFNIVMNSISNLPLSTNARLILYADDVLLFKPIDSAADAESLQLDVDKVIKWMSSQGLTPNHTKTQLLPITRSTNPLHIMITINGHPIAPSSSVKYLGVTISSNLSWSEHIASTCKKAKRQLGFIHRRFCQSPPQVRGKLYRATVLPKLEYCSAVWDPHKLTDIAKLEDVQKFAARITTRMWKADYDSLTSTLSWQHLSVRRKLQKLKVCYNILNNLSIIPADTFTPHPYPLPRHPHSRILFRPFARTAAHQSSFFINVIPIWNNLPSFVVNSPNPFIFKRRLITHFCPT